MQIAIGLYPGFTALDAIGPYQVLAHLPGVQVAVCAARPGPVPDDNGLLTFEVDHTFDDVPSPDVLSGTPSKAPTAVTDLVRALLGEAEARVLDAG